MSPATARAPVLRHVLNGSERIVFLLSRSPRKTLAITVHPDLRVEAMAPLDAAEPAILARVEARAGWIQLQRGQFLSWMPKPAPRRYRAGETHLYLGTQYQLKVVAASTNKVRLKGNHIEVYQAGSLDPGAVRESLTAWYRQRAEVIFHQEMAKALQRMRTCAPPEPQLRLLRMPKRWGSCTAMGDLLLNPELIKAPGLCIEYVIVHELCHLKHPNHSAAFFRMLDAVLPDWRERKERLEQTDI